VNDKKFPEPVEALVLILAIFSGILFTILITNAIVFSNDGSIETRTVFGIYLLYGKSFFLLFALWYSYKRRYDLKRLFRVENISGNSILTALLISIFVYPVVDEVDRIIEHFIPSPEVFNEIIGILQNLSFDNWILFIFGTVIISSISEEAIFRGFLQTTLERKGDPARAVILTSISWALIYVNPYDAIPIFVFGVVIGFTAWKLKTIWAAIIIHSTKTIIDLFFLKYPDEFSWYFSGEHVSPVILIIGAAGLYYILSGKITFLKDEQA
jgi:membrane protease YdiL (CAAX protease family)